MYAVEQEASEQANKQELLAGFEALRLRLR
jgi:hypothetical protein